MQMIRQGGCERSKEVGDRKEFWRITTVNYSNHKQMVYNDVKCVQVTQDRGKLGTLIMAKVSLRCLLPEIILISYGESQP
jgi:hypothetical protein